MRVVLIFGVIVLMAGAGCRKSTRATDPAATAARPVETRASQVPAPAPRTGLQIELDATDVVAMWGMVTEVPVRVEWREGQKYAVQLSVAGAPEGVLMDAVPPVVTPPGRTVLRIEPVVGKAPLTRYTAQLEAAAYGLTEPVREIVTINVVRQDGEFVPVMAGPVTLECRNVCGKVAGGRVTFYDVLREKEQDCSERAVLPESQRVGARSYAVSAEGFGFGRTCRVAAVFEPGGRLLLVNIGPPTTRVPRGEVFGSIPQTQQCWLSPDNTLALAKAGAALRLYDVYSGRAVGDACMLTGDISLPLLIDGKVSAGGCEWQVR